MRMTDRFRVVIALDADAFYASSILSRPENRNLSSLPVGVYQKHIVVTTNYVARGRGVAKMSSIDAARQVCPDIVLIDGSDLAPFRRSAAQIRAIIADTLPQSTPIEYLGLDEIFVDCTDIIAERSKIPVYPWKFEGYVCESPTCTDEEDGDGSAAARMRTLQLGSQLAAELRNVIFEQSGITFCAGIAPNKIAAKIAAKIHKPNSQTCFPNISSVASYVASRPLTVIPGFGRGYHARLQAWSEKRPANAELSRGIETISDFLETFSSPSLGAGALSTILSCSRSHAVWILNACKGIDDRPVKPATAPTSVSCEDACRNCSDMHAVRRNLYELSSELMERLAEDAVLHGDRRPGTLTVKFRHRGTGPKFTTRSVAMPSVVSSSLLIAENADRGLVTRAVFDESLRVLAQNNIADGCPAFALSLLGVGACNFSKKPRFRTRTSCRGREISNSASTSHKSDSAVGSGTLTPTCCPVCGVTLGCRWTEFRMNSHVDRCLRQTDSAVGEAEQKRKRMKLTKMQTLHVDSFFSKTNSS